MTQDTGLILYGTVFGLVLLGNATWYAIDPEGYVRDDIAMTILLGGFWPLTAVGLAIWAVVGGYILGVRSIAKRIHDRRHPPLPPVDVYQQHAEREVEELLQ